LTFYRDADGDHYGNPALTTTSLFSAGGYGLTRPIAMTPAQAVHSGAAELQRH